MRKIIVLLAMLLLGGTQAHAQATVEQCFRATPTGFCQAVNATNPLPVTASSGGSTTANQGTPAATANSWPMKVTDGTNGPAAVTLPADGAVGSLGLWTVTQNMLFDGTSWDRWRAAIALTDGAAGDGIGATAGWVFNGTSFDRVRSPLAVGNGTTTPTGVLTATSLRYNGNGWFRDFTCDQTALVNLAASTTAQLVSGSVSQIIRVCSFVVTAGATASTVQFIEGTGATCGTATQNITGAMNLAVNGNISANGGSSSVFRTQTSGNALCAAPGAGAVTGVLSYVKF